MKNTIQEEEMHFTSKYCKDFLNEISEFLMVSQNRFNSVLSSCNQKIQEEKKDIEFLKSEISTAQGYLQENKDRLAQIPKEINDYERDIDICQNAIFRTEVPVYTSYYSEYYGWQERIDHEATRINKDYIDSLQREIEDDRNKINELRQLEQRCKNNVSKLEEIIRQMETNVQKKQELIDKVNKDITFIHRSFDELKKSVMLFQDEIMDIDSKVNKCIEYISGYGNAMSGIRYNNSVVTYSQKNVINVTSNDINQEINILNAVIANSNQSINKCLKGLNSYMAAFEEDEIAGQVKDVALNVLKASSKINEAHATNVAILKKALKYIGLYEDVKF